MKQDRLTALLEAWAIAQQVEREFGALPGVAARVIQARIATLIELTREQDHDLHTLSA